MLFYLLPFLALALLPLATQAAIISGQVSASETEPVNGTRVTLFTDDLQVFHERRTDAEGRFSFRYVPEGNYRLGVAARGYEYVERGERRGSGRCLLFSCKS